MRYPLWLRVIAWLWGGTAVWLRDSGGEVCASIAYRDPFGGTWARRYPITAVGHCVLRDDGTIDPGSSSSYLKQWKPA
jgi:hypothetical protein